MTRNIGRLASSAAIAALIVLSGCDKSEDGDGNAQLAFALPDLPATLPLENGPATAVECAPSASDLPDAPPLRAARIADPGQAYGYADAAYSYDEALGDAPPDYAFDYEGIDPWAWQGYDDSLMFAEPIDDGNGYRYYYYRPGASEPYFIRDPYYSYGFAGGLLAAIYAADGGLVRYADYGPRLGYASRYYVRGQGLYRAARGGGRRPVVAANWQRRSPVIFAARSRWGAGRAHQPGWASYHRANLPRQTAYWREERVRRGADAQRFDGWRAAGFRGAPPPRAIPSRWADAKWAKDDRKFRPAAEARNGREAGRDRTGDRPDNRAENRDVRRDRQKPDGAGREGQRVEATRPEAVRAERREQRAQARDDRPNRPEQEQRGPQRAEREQRREQSDQPRREQAERQQAQREQAQRQRTERQQGQRQQVDSRQAQREDHRQRSAQARSQGEQRPDRAQRAGIEQQQRQQQRDTGRAQKQAERQAQQQQQRARGEQQARQQQQQAERQQAERQQAQQQTARQQQQQQRADRQPRPEPEASARAQSKPSREERREQRQRDR